jgi:hypothetical protein
VKPEPCPVCGTSSTYNPPDTVDIGVGCIAIGPDEWICPKHGRWCIEDGKPVVEFSEPQRADEDEVGVRK